MNIFLIYARQGPPVWNPAKSYLLSVLQITGFMISMDCFAYLTNATSVCSFIVLIIFGYY